MPPLPTIADTFRCALEWDHNDGAHAVNVIHLNNVTGGVTPADVAADISSALTAATAGGGTNWLQATVSGASITGVDITPLDGLSASEHFSLAFPGTSSADYAPQVAIVNTVKTSLRGRVHRGRIFLPFVREDSTTAGRLNAGDETVVQAGATAFRGFLDGTHGHSSELGVASYKLSQFTPAIQLIAHRELATQRRRAERVRFP